jgi:glycosyltransferase involved in cell wall biosynthesis
LGVRYLIKKLSIIIPVYNVENYLNQCLKSLYQIEIDNIEYIIVDDGSTDNSSGIIDEYYKLYSNSTIVIKQSNRGLASARNAGLEVASGDYIAFIDSDDYISSRDIEKLYYKAIENNLEIVIGDYVKFTGENFLINNKKNKTLQTLENLDVTTGMRYLEESFDGNEVEVTVWRCVYKKNFLDENNIRFKDNILHEDVLFTFTAFRLAICVQFYPIEFYYYRQREGSIMNKPSLKSYKSKLFIVNELQNIIENNNVKSKCWDSIVVKMYSNVVRVGKIKDGKLYKRISKNNNLSLSARIRKIMIPIYNIKAKEIHTPITLLINE